MHSDADQLGEMKGGKPVSSVDDRLMDTNQPAREGSGIFIRSQQVRDPKPGTRGDGFYNVNDADSAIIASDEQLKGTHTNGELRTILPLKRAALSKRFP